MTHSDQNSRSLRPQCWAQVNSWKSGPSTRTGGALALILMLTILLMTFGAFAINLSQMQLVRTEMQVASDASARAAGRIFANTRDFPNAQALAQQVANNNRVNGRNLVLRPSDFELGTAVRANLAQRYQYSAGGPNPNSIILRTEMSGSSPSGAVNLFLPGFAGFSTTDIRMEARSTQVELDIAVVIDRSGSMAFRADQVAKLPTGWTSGAPLPTGFTFGSAAPDPSRWRDTVAGIQVFLDELNATPQLEHVSLVTYATGATIDLNLTTNYSNVISRLGVHSARFNGGGTDIRNGLRSANNVLVGSNNRPWAVKVVVLMTDGIEDSGNSVTQAQVLASRGIMIYTVTFSKEANQTRMRSVASAGGGKHYHATDAASLSTVFRDIARQMPTLVTQ